MFGRRILGGQPDGFRLSLGYEVEGEPEAPTPGPQSASVSPASQRAKPSLQDAAGWQLEHNGSHLETVDVEWTSDDPEPVAISRLKKSGLPLGRLEERVCVSLEAVQQDSIANAATFLKDVSARLAVVAVPPQLRLLEFARTVGAGTPQPALLTTLVRECDLGSVAGLRCCEGLLPLWEPALLARLGGLRSLTLSACGLTQLPPEVSALSGLRELRVGHNRLAALPRELGSLAQLRSLAADHNLLTSIPVELRGCSRLRELGLEGNRLATPVLDLRSLARLRSLQLFGNPLEFLPELSPATALHDLSLANVRLRCDEGWRSWEVDVSPPPQSYMGRGSHRLALLFALIFRRASCQHPLLAGALGKIAEEPANCSVIAREVGAIQQLILMALSDNEVVVEQACKTIGLLGRHNSIATNEIIGNNVLGAMLQLIGSVKHAHQLAGLAVISGLALSSEAAARKLLTPAALRCLADLVRCGADDVKTASLETIGNLAFARANRVTLLHTPRLLAWLRRLAFAQVPGVSLRSVQVTATRALAILGENEAVREAVGRPPIVGRGVRVLAMDGGGMKGIAAIRQLRQLEERTGRRVHELFDLICGTSTGGVLAVALALKQFSLDECEQIYRTLGQRVFMRPGGGGAAREDDGWRESLLRAYRSGQQSMRVAVYGCKHDAVMFEALLREYCVFEQPGLAGSAMIDTACLPVPKCFVVATLASVTPAEPFVFRNYELPLASTGLARRIMACAGSSSHQVWEAMRASSAAPYYLDDFKCGDDRFQDGAATANNPAAIALQEARALWPDKALECLVSVGTGEVPRRRREKSMSAYVDTGNVLIESACSVDRVAAALATLAPLVPGLSYFRFSPSDARCSMELDEIDPAKWALLEAATDEYIAREDAAFDACARLLVHHAVDRPPRKFDVSTLALGPRRGLMVVEAPRATPADATHAVEASCRAAARQPACCVHAPLGSPEAGDLPTEARGAGRALAALLEAHREQAGVLHLGCHGDGEGLVTAWRRDLEAVAEPSEAASALLREAGAAGGTSLCQLAASQPGWEGGGGAWVQLLSQQGALTPGARGFAFLLQRTRAAERLTAAEVPRMLGCWQGLVVATPSTVPRPLARALLEAGAAALVCRAADSPPPRPGSAAAAFFDAFYERLLRGRPLLASLAHAGTAVPSLAGTFVCCHLKQGVLTAADPAADPAADSSSDSAPDAYHLGGSQAAVGALPGAESFEVRRPKRYRSWSS